MVDVVEITTADWLVIESPARTESVEIALPIVELVEVAEQGPMGPPGVPGPAGGTAMVFIATTAIGGHRVLTLNAASEVIYASNDSPSAASQIIGMSINAAAPGGELSVQRAGEVEESSWNWVMGLPVYLGANGLLTQFFPSGAAFSLIVGFPTAPTKLFLAFREPVFLT